MCTFKLELVFSSGSIVRLDLVNDAGGDQGSGRAVVHGIRC